MFKKYITVKNIFFFLLLVLVCIFFVKVNEIAMLFFACYVIACSLNPIVNFLVLKKMNRSLASILVVSVSAIVTLAFLIPIATIAVSQFTLFIKTIPEKILSLQVFINNINFGGYSLSKYINLNEAMPDNSNIVHQIVSSSLNLTYGLLQSIIIFIAVITILFYLLKDSAYIQSKFIEFFPSKMKNRAKDISEKISSKVGGYVIAQILSNIAIWVLVTIGLAILKVSYPISLGFIAGLLDVIPIVGPTIALTLILTTASPLGLVTLIICIIWFLAVQQISNNLVRPLVFGKFLELHPLVIIFALFVAGQFFGVIGLIFAPAIAAIVSVLIDELYLKTINKYNDKQE